MLTLRVLITNTNRQNFKLNSIQPALCKMSTETKCIFCKICAKTAPAELLYENEELVVFKDIKPSAKFHYLVVTKQHIKSAAELTPNEKPLLTRMIDAGKDVLSKNGGEVSETRFGFHWPPFNSISHLHLHVISPISDMGFIHRQIFRPNTWWFASADYVMDKLNNKL